MRPRLLARRVVFLATATALAAPSAQDLSAQGLADLTTACIGSGTAGAAACAQGALAVGALQAHLGTVTGLGSEVAGSASTLGRRLGTSPRIALSARTGLARASLPDRTAPAGTPGEDSFTLPTVQVGLTAGVFDGFFLLPTVGGFLSLDLMAHTSVVFLPSGAGFQERAQALSVGARLGIFRESFTLPGVSLSVTRRFMGEVELGSLAAGDAYQIAVKPSVTSVRGTVGKDLFALGILAGMGWDSFGGTASLRTGDASAGVADLKATRTLFFGGASMNFLVLQLSAELGWARGFHPVSGYSGPFNARASTYFGSVAFRLTL